MPKLSEMIGAKRCELVIGGETFEVAPLSLIHFAMLEDETGRGVSSAGARSISFLLDMITVLIDESGQIGLEGATWAEKRRLVGERVRFEDLPGLSAAIGATMPQISTSPAPALDPNVTAPETVQDPDGA